MIIIKIIERKADETKVVELSKKYNISKDIVSFLLGRNVPENIIPLLVSKEELELLPNNSLTNIEEAAELISKYLVDNANIYIYGDYDSDGVNATYIMYMALIELAEGLEVKTNIVYHLPNRNEGYGLSMDWCEQLEDDDNTLVITVDNGISKVEEVEYLKSRGIEVLITDHHKPQAEVPDCLIVDAHLNDTDNVNACGLCGAAVAYKVVAYGPKSGKPSNLYYCNTEHYQKNQSIKEKGKIDKDKDGIDDQTDILNNARDYIKTKPKYKSKYYTTGYPDDEYGVCTDVVAFALKDAGYDLMELVNEDIKANKDLYNIDSIDKKIDFRRVQNLKIYLDNNAISLTTDINKINEWQGGDIVVFKKHIGIVSDNRNKKGISFIIHHANPYQRYYEEDILEYRDDIVGHYRIS